MTRQFIGITGADGFIGEALMRRLGGRDNVLALSRRQLDSGRRGRQVELADASACIEATRDCRVLVHLAYDGGWHERNVEIAANLAAAARANNIDKVVHLSTIDVYSRYNAGLLSLDSRLARDESAYAEAKLVIEHRLSAANRRYSLVLVRPAIVAGAGGYWSNTAFDHCKAETLHLPASGDYPCNVVYVDDLAEALEQLIDADVVPGRIEKVLVGRATTWGDFYLAHAQVLSKLGLPCSLNIAGDDARFRFGASRTQTSLGVLKNRVSMLSWFQRRAASLRRVKRPNSSWRDSLQAGCNQKAILLSGMVRWTHMTRFEIDAEHDSTLNFDLPARSLGAMADAMVVEIRSQISSR